MEICNYQDTANHIDEMGEKIDSLSNKEAKQVSEFIDTIKEKAEQERISQSLAWFQSAILPPIQAFAEMTYSRLSIETNEATVIATLENRQGLDIAESCRVIRTLITFSNHIGINATEDAVSLTLIFDCSKFNG